MARKIAVAKKEAAKARAGKNSFPPTPFLFARPSVQFRFCRAKRGNQSVSFKIGSDLVKQTHQYQTFRFFPDQFGGALRRLIRQNGVSARFARGEPVFPFSAALRAAESIGKIPESLIVVRLFDEIRTYFERN